MTRSLTEDDDASSRHRISADRPAAAFHDSFLLGNGALGAAVRGFVGTERVHLNRDTFWSGGPLDEAAVPDRSEWLQPIRDAVRADDHVAAHQLSRNLQAVTWSQSYLPVGSLDWAYAPGDPSSTTDYGRSLDLATAEAHARYTADGATVELDSFVSAPADVLVMIATTPDAADPVFESPHPFALTEHPLADGLTARVYSGRAPAISLPDYVTDANAVVYDESPVPADGLVPAGMGFAVAVVTQHIDGGTRVIVSVVDGFRGRGLWPSADAPALAARAVETAATAARQSTAALRQAHRADYSFWFDRVELDLSTGNAGRGPSAAEQFFDYGRYLLIASSRPGTQPANLQGIWNDDPRPGWSCSYTTNINLQMNYWPANAVGLSELTEPLRTWISELPPLGGRTARAVYGADGWALHHNSDIWGYSEPVDGEPQWANWNTAGLWLCAHLWDHYSYTGDRTYARDILWPTLAGAVRFLLDALQPDTDGCLIVVPSTSPEHLFRAGDQLVAVTGGTTIDQELASEALRRVLELAAAGLAPDDPATTALIARSRDSLARLREPGIGESGALLEWDHDFVPEDRGHRHFSHLYGLHPGSSIDEADSPERFRAAQRAIADRVDHGSGHTGWSQSWILCLAARTRDRELVARSVDILVDDLTSASMLDLHPVATNPTGYLFQIDGNFGAVAGIVEAFVQSQRDVIRLFNAVPEQWATGRLAGIETHGGSTVSLEWAEGRLVRGTVTARRDGVITICLPEGEYRATDAGTGGPIRLEPAEGAVPPGRRRLVWQATSGGHLELRAVRD